MAVVAVTGSSADRIGVLAAMGIAVDTESANAAGVRIRRSRGLHGDGFRFYEIGFRCCLD